MGESPKAPGDRLPLGEKAETVSKSPTCWLKKTGGRQKSPPCSSGSADRQRGGKPMLPLNGQRRESSAEYGRGHSSSFGFRKEFDQFQVVRFIDFLRRPAPWADKHMTDEVVARNNLSVATAARKVEIYSFDL